MFDGKVIMLCRHLNVVNRNSTETFPVYLLTDNTKGTNTSIF